MTTLSLLSDDGTHVNFPLFQKKSETTDAFLNRIFGLADVWCPLANEAQIPTSGYVQDVWNQYIRIRLMSYDELDEDIYYTEDSSTRYSQGVEGVYCRTWLSLLRLEARRREETSD